MGGPEPSSLRFEWIEPPDDGCDEWSRLALASRNVFSSWEWVRTWLYHLGDRDRFGVLGFRRPDAALAGMLPVAFEGRGPIRMARIAGHGPADQLGPVCAPQDRGMVAASIVRAAASGELPRLLVIDRLDRREGWVGALGARVLHRESSPTLALQGGSWEDYLAGRSANFRSQVRRAERKLVRDHALSFRLCDSPRRLRSDFDALIGLHRARWGRESLAFANGLEEFHRDFAAAALERGWLRLWLAEVDGRPVAAWHGFRYAEAESFYQAGRDPAWGRSKVGFVLMAHTIRTAFEDGMREYRFLRGDEAYKSRFTDSGDAVETVALGNGVGGRLAAGVGAGLAATRWGRRLLSRVGG